MSVPADDTNKRPSIWARIARRIARHALGAEHARAAYPPDFTPDTIATIERVAPYTMTSPERILSVCQAVEHIVRHDIPGAIVECGVWRGGSMMAAAITLQRLGALDRELYMFDTFEGMTEPSDVDRDARGTPAEALGPRRAGPVQATGWCRASLEDVAANLDGTGYPAERLHFVKGRVEQTVPSEAPETIALLRLDTDWYESTWHELEHMYARLTPGGILIIDDYGHWQGARKAVDQFLASLSTPVFLARIDYTGRIAIKPTS